MADLAWLERLREKIDQGNFSQEDIDGIKNFLSEEEYAELSKRYSDRLMERVEKLLHDLESEDAAHRKIAAEELGKLSISNEQIVSMLEKVAASDSNTDVAKAAHDALLAPAHRRVFQHLGRQPATSISQEMPTQPISSFDPSACAFCGTSGPQPRRDFSLPELDLISSSKRGGQFWKMSTYSYNNIPVCETCMQKTLLTHPSRSAIFFYAFCILGAVVFAGSVSVFDLSINKDEMEGYIFLGLFIAIFVTWGLHSFLSSTLRGMIDAWLEKERQSRGIFLCPQCKMPFDTENDLKQHIANWHKQGIKK